MTSRRSGRAARTVHTSWWSLAASALLSVLSGCSADLPHRWVDDARGIEFHSDFTERHVRLLYDERLATKVDLLRGVFGDPSLQGLRVFVHDQRTAAVGGATAVGWHGNGEIHVMAALLPGIGVPSFVSMKTFDHELVHALVQRAALRLPRWFEEGLCEVLAASPVDRGGRLVLLADGPREQAVRRLRAEGKLLNGAALLACEDGYPEGVDAMAAMYAQGTSFVRFLLGDGPVTKDGLAALAATPRDAMLARYADWERALPDTSLVALFAAALGSDDAAVRCSAVEAVRDAPRDAEFWRAMALRLVDAESDVRSTARLALYRPTDEPAAREQFAAWRAGADARLRVLASLGLAQLGDAAAVADFLRAVAAGEGGQAAAGDRSDDWSQPLMWVRLSLPRDGVPLSPPLGGGPAAERGYAAALLQQFEAQRDGLVWNAKAWTFAPR